MDKKRSQDKDATEQCPGGKVQKLDKGRSNERERETLPSFPMDRNNIDAIMDKLDAMPDLPNWEPLWERYDKLIRAGVFRCKEE